MTTPVPTAVPDDLIAGDSWQFDLSFGDYPAGVWDATAYFRGVGSLDIEATADGGTHQFRATPAQSADLPAGVYRYFIKVTDGTDTFTVDQGEIEVLPNAATAAAGDLQTDAEEALALVNAAIKALLQNPKESVQIFGRAWTNIDIDTLRKLRAGYLAEVARQRHRGKLPSTEVVFRRA